jgi:hypothetical protein
MKAAVDLAGHHHQRTAVRAGDEVGLARALAAVQRIGFIALHQA